MTDDANETRWYSTDRCRVAMYDALAWLDKARPRDVLSVYYSPARGGKVSVHIGLDDFVTLLGTGRAGLVGKARAMGGGERFTLSPAPHVEVFAVREYVAPDESDEVMQASDARDELISAKAGAK